MRVHLAIAVAVAAAGLGSCGHSSSSPSPTPSQVLVALGISGASTVAPNATTQMSVTGTYADGSTKDVTTGATWRSSDNTLLTISGTGLASGVRSGDVTVTATVSGRQSAMAILVVPAGTYRLTGQVLESGAPVGTATVQVTAGTGTGLTTFTDFSGNYRLYGVAGEIQLAARKDGYVTTTQAATVSANGVLNISVTPITPEANLAGTYALTIAADPSCPTTGAGALPDVARARHYSATIMQVQSPLLSVALSGATFLVTAGAGNGFSGRVAPDGITFLLNGYGFYYYYYPDLVEVLSPSSVYEAEGSVSVVRSGADLLGTLNGTIRVEAKVFGKASASCTSAQHSMRFTNQAASPARAKIRR